MYKISKKDQQIIAILLQHDSMQSSQIHDSLLDLKQEMSLVTVKRALSDMSARGLLIMEGFGRSTSYIVSDFGRFFADVDAKKYCAEDPDKRIGLRTYNFNLFASLSEGFFVDDEAGILQDATEEYKRKIFDLPLAIEKKELERMVIELSWKSSKIEGNTYTLLDTEKLILENKEAQGHSKHEAVMILNHKLAFEYVRKNVSEFKNLNRKNLESLHAVLVKDLSVGLGLRLKPVGVTGSIYKPLDNIHQIAEAVETLSKAIERIDNPYSKALLALAGISYIQPFEDGNKRTARLMTNAILMSHKLSPLSYRSVEENDFREAMLVFYELNSIIPIKKIFISQYDFAARNYAVVPSIK